MPDRDPTLEEKFMEPTVPLPKGAFNPDWRTETSDTASIGGAAGDPDCPQVRQLKKDLGRSSTPTFEQIGRDLGTCGEKIAHVNGGVKDCKERLNDLASRFEVGIDNLIGAPDKALVGDRGAQSEPSFGDPVCLLDVSAFNIGCLLDALDRLSNQINRL